MLERFGLKTYEDPALEAAFNNRYAQHGNNLLMAASLVCSFMSATTFLRDFFFLNPDPFVQAKQVIRFVLSILAVAIFFVLFREKSPSYQKLKHLQLLLFALISLGLLVFTYMLNRGYSDEAYARWITTVVIAIIGLSALLRLPTSWLILLFIGLILGILAFSVELIKSNPRTWVQGQINIVCALLLGMFVHITNRWNERRLFELQLQIDEQLVSEEKNGHRKTKFLSALSHDLKQPLTGLIGYLELAENQLSPTSAEREYIRRAQNSAEAINKNLTRVLELARIQDIAYDTKVEPINLRQVLDLLDKLYEAQVVTQGIKFKIVTPANNHVFVVSNFDLLFQILQNLIANAIKYRRAAPVQTTILLNVTQLNNGLTKISVVDNGIGVQTNDRERIFEPYFQAYNQERNNAKGLGLGLAFVKEAIQRLPKHQITLWSNSKSLTKFDIRLPTFEAHSFESIGDALVASKAMTSSEPNRLQQRTKVELKALRVLLIEDDALVRDFLNAALENEVQAIQIVDDFELLDFDQLQANEINFIICDYNLPSQKNGVDLVSQIRGQSQYDLPALIVSGNSIVNLPDNFVNVRFLPKPFNVSQLLKAISELLKDSNRTEDQ